MTAILGISAFYHDSAAAIIVDGVVVAAAQEERFTRVKHESGFPHQAIEFCLAQSRLSIEELDHVVFYEKPFRKFERILETYLQAAPAGFKSFTTAMPIWLSSKLYLSRIIAKGLSGKYRKRIIFPDHHESHAASAYFPSPFEQAAILTADGAGEWATTTVGVGNRNRIERHKQIDFPDSLGLLYSAFTYFCGFRVNGGEGKLMGLAPFGTACYTEQILEQIVDVKQDGSFRLNPEFFNYAVGNTMTSHRFDDLFDGPPRTPESTITEREKNLAASIQQVTETILLRIANRLHADTGMKNLCVAGGVGLNCVANGRLLRESPFENVWVQPAAGDAGGALGAALFVWHQLLGQPRQPNPACDPFLGPDTTRSETESMLTNASAVYHEFENDAEMIEHVADQLSQQKIVGWMQGRMEFGPRALGNRSVLADPRNPQMQSLLNQRIKFREDFRPFAPVVLEDRCREFFELEHPSPAMCFAGNAIARPPGASAEASDGRAIPAVTHVDGSARIQTVNPSQNAKLHGLLEAFQQKTGCPLLVNTSFNVRGEPIVCRAADAYRCFMKTELDTLVIGNFVLKKSDQPEFQPAQEAPVTRSIWHRIMSAWKSATFPIRWLASKAVLGVIFYLCVLPIGLVVRRRHGDSFPTSNPTQTYWTPSQPAPHDPASYFKQY